MDKRKFEFLIDYILRSNNFRKKADTWYRKGGDSLHVFNMQKSSYGNQYYINLCLAPNGMEIEGLPTPKENKCPIRARLAVLLSEDEKLYTDRLLNLEDATLPDMEREAEFTKILSAKVIPFFDEIESIGLKKAINQGCLKKFLVSMTAKQYLGVVE